MQPIAARTSNAACATVAQVCHTFSSPPASAAAYIWCASLHSTVRTTVRVHRAAWLSNRFQLANRLAAVHAHGSAATRTLNDQPWPAGVQTISAKSLHRNAPSAQQPSPNFASKQTTAVRTAHAPVGAPACPTPARAVAQLSEHQTQTSAPQSRQELRHHTKTSCAATAQTCEHHSPQYSVDLAGKSRKTGVVTLYLIDDAYS